MWHWVTQNSNLYQVAGFVLLLFSNQKDYKILQLQLTSMILKAIILATNNSANKIHVKVSSVT
jgi:hypothetical protein